MGARSRRGEKLIEDDNLGKNSDAAFNAHFGEEEVVSQEAFLKPTEFHQPAEETRALQVEVLLHNVSCDAPVLDRTRQIGRQVLQRLPQRGHHHQSLLPVLPSIVSRSLSVSASISRKPTATRIIAPAAGELRGRIAPHFPPHSSPPRALPPARGRHHNLPSIADASP